MNEGAPPERRAPGAAFLLGKILNAFLLDHIDVDIELLRRLNDVLADGRTAYGPGFGEQMSRAARERGAPTYRYVQLHDHATVGRHRPPRQRSRAARALPRRRLRRQAPLLPPSTPARGDEADLASYLLFDGDFCRQLIEMGRADAEARRDELLDFFGSASDDPGPMSEGSGSWGRSSVAIPIGT